MCSLFLAWGGEQLFGYMVCKVIWPLYRFEAFVWFTLRVSSFLLFLDWEQILGIQSETRLSFLRLINPSFCSSDGLQISQNEKMSFPFFHCRLRNSVRRLSGRWKPADRNRNRKAGERLWRHLLLSLGRVTSRVKPQRLQPQLKPWKGTQAGWRRALWSRLCCLCCWQCRRSCHRNQSLLRLAAWSVVTLGDL